MNEFAVPDDLDAILADVWSRLGRGTKDRHAAFHTPVVATRDGGGVRQRIMVLRGIDPAAAMLRFHTDARSAKVIAVGDGGPVSVLGYDPGHRIQISLAGVAHIGDAPTTDAAWAATALTSRRCYLVEPGPGSAVPERASGLPAGLQDRAPAPAESEAGRANFATLIVTASQIEWLQLDAHGNRRARFVRAGQRWDGTWLIP